MTNIKRWMNNEDYRTFVRQVTVDVMVARKNGVPSEDIDNQLDILIQDIGKELRDLNPISIDN